MTAARGCLTVTAKGLAWFKTGHPWIYRNDLEKIQDALPGDVVTLEKKNGDFLAQGFYSDRSKIAFRLISRSPAPIDAAAWGERLLRASHFRRKFVSQAGAFRLVYGESDGIPSLIVDRYAEHLVVQTLSQGPEKLLPVFVDLFHELFHPASIVLRNDLAVRELEGLPQEKKVLYGKVPENVEILEGAIRYGVDLWNGQKTGTYLDQRETRQFAGGLLRGRVLDAFCYQGLFALHCARSASQVIGIDSSQEALDHARENGRLNELSNLEFRRENVFDLLKAQAAGGERYDGIILDPPAFAKSRENVSGATRGYKELNLRAIRLLNPGGILVTCSCSYNLAETHFIEILKDAARDAGADLRLIAKRGQSADHPVLLAFPESTYLKTIVLEKIS